MLEVGYPDESSFYPKHLIIMSTIAIVYLIILNIAERKYKKGQRQSNNAQQSKWNWLPRRAELVTLGGAIVAAFALISPFQYPLLDYTVHEPQLMATGKNETLKIDIHNYGFASAKHVIISMNAHNVSFLRLSTEPFLSTDFKYNTTLVNHTGYAFSKIAVLPPKSSTIITTTLNINGSRGNISIIPYVRSDEQSAYHNAIYADILYAIFLSLLVFTPYIIFVLNPESWIKRYYGGVIVTVIIINIFIFLYLSCDDVIWCHSYFKTIYH
jgi:hypothetical protein